MITRLRFRNGGSVVLYGGARTCDHQIKRKLEFSTDQKLFGNGSQTIRAKVRVPLSGRTTLVMTFGLVACSNAYRNWDFTLNGAILTVTYPPPHGGVITVR
jgi:hypothetical protein